MHYYPIIDGPHNLEHEGQSVLYFTLGPESENIEDPETEVVACEFDLDKDQQKMTITKMMNIIDIYYKDMAYEYRAMQVYRNDDGTLRNAVVEVESCGSPTR